MNNQCLECAWRFIEHTGHCYMFKEQPEFRCMKRKPDLAKPVAPLDENWKFQFTDEELERQGKLLYSTSDRGGVK